MNNSKNLAGSYSHFPSPMKSYILSVVMILCCAVPAAIVSSWVWKAFGLEGISLAIAAISKALKITK
jgi:hypothetical protein